MAVTVTDVNDNPVAGAKVTFSAPGSGPSGVFAGHGPAVAVITSSKGVAVAPNFSANEAAGGYLVTARVAGLAGMATFAMVNAARSQDNVANPAGSYWLATEAGQVLTSGSATRYRAPSGKGAPSDVVGIAATPDEHGYWLVTKSGAVYTYGDAGKYGAHVAGTHSSPVRSWAWLLPLTGTGIGWPRRTVPFTPTATPPTTVPSLPPG